MKITHKTLMINVEHEISIGNDAITATVIHQVCLYEGKDGEVQTDVDFLDITDIRFLGVEIESGYKAFREFKEQMLKLKIDVDKLVDEACVGLISVGDVQQLKLKYSNIFQK